MVKGFSKPDPSSPIGYQCTPALERKSDDKQNKASVSTKVGGKKKTNRRKKRKWMETIKMEKHGEQKQSVKNMDGE